MGLLEVPLGKWVRIVGLKGDARLRDRLTHHGLYPGDNLRVLRTAPLDGPLLVEVNGRELALGREVAGKILVEITSCDSL